MVNNQEHYQQPKVTMVITGRGSYIAVRYVDGLLDVSSGVTTETVEPSLLLLLLLQLQ